MSKFDFDLQLFAEEVEQPVEDSTETNDVDYTLTEDGQVIFNPSIFDGNFSSEEEEEVQPEEQEVEPKDTEPSNPQEEMYIVKVDGQEMEVPLSELLDGYMRQKDYTRKTQEVAEQRRALQSAPPQTQPQQPQPQVTPEQPAFSQKEYIEKLTEFAKGQVEQTLGVQFDQYNPMHLTALSDAVASIKAEITVQQQAQMAAEAEERRFQQNLTKYTSDPNFAKIDALAYEKLNSLPYAQAVKIQSAFQNKDWEIIDAYMTAVRNEYYGQNNAPSIRRKETPKQPRIKPPYMEPSGAATQPPNATSRQVDLNSLGKMSNDDLANLYRQMGLTNL